MTLYEITADMMELQALLLEAPDDECLNDTLESVEFDLQNKVDGYCKVMANIQEKIDAMSKEIKRLQDRKKVAENAKDRLKSAISNALEVMDKDRVEGKLFTVSMRNNALKLPKDIDWTKLDMRYLIEQEPKINRKALLEDVKAGKVEGIELERTKSLQIR